MNFVDYPRVRMKMMVNSEAIAVMLQKICTSSPPFVGISGSVTAGDLAEFRLRDRWSPKCLKPCVHLPCARYARGGLLNPLGCGKRRPLSPTATGTGGCSWLATRRTRCRRPAASASTPPAAHTRAESRLVLTAPGQGSPGTQIGAAGQVRSGLSPGGRWIRTSGSAREEIK